MTTILAVLEQRDGVLKKVSHEVLTAARGLANAMDATVDALLVGPVGLSADGLGQYGADRVCVVAENRLRLYQARAYTAAFLWTPTSLFRSSVPSLSAVASGCQVSVASSLPV